MHECELCFFFQESVFMLFVYVNIVVVVIVVVTAAWENNINPLFIVC